MNDTKTYFEMSNFDTPPDTIVKLGQIIHDYKDPGNLVAPPPSHPPLQHVPIVYTTERRDWQLTRKKLREGSVGVFAEFLASILGIGGDLALLLNHEYEDVLKFDILETRFIEPDGRDILPHS